MNVREIDFLTKFWQVKGANILMVELFLTIINHRIELIGKALEDNPNLCNEEMDFYSNAKISLEKIAESCLSLFPVLVNCNPKEFKDCMREYFDEYSECVRTYFLSTNFRMYLISELETSISLQHFMLFYPSQLSASKPMALDLISHYIVLLEFVKKIILKIESNGQQIGLNWKKVDNIIDELRSIYGTIEGIQGLPKDASDPDQRDSSQYYNLIRRFHYLIETIVDDYDPQQLIY